MGLLVATHVSVLLEWMDDRTARLFVEDLASHVVAEVAIAWQALISQEPGAGKDGDRKSLTAAYRWLCGIIFADRLVVSFTVPALQRLFTDTMRATVIDDTCASFMGMAEKANQQLQEHVRCHHRPAWLPAKALADIAAHIPILQFLKNAA